MAKLPFVGVRTAGGHKLAAFECFDGLGFLTTLYCQPDHRFQGIGSAVERRICQRIIEEWAPSDCSLPQQPPLRLDVWPIKLIAYRRPRVGKMTERSPLWTLLRDERERPIDFYYTYLSKVYKPPIEVIEN